MIEKITAYRTHISIHTGQIQLGSVLLLTGTNLKTFFFFHYWTISLFFWFYILHIHIFIFLCVT